jgi:hypothetical protein
LEDAWSKLLVPQSFFERIHSNCREMLRYPGAAVAGDEKLLHFTGDSAYIRQVKSKPDRIGLWFFELTCMLEGKIPFLLDMFLSKANTETHESVAVSAVTERWGEIVVNYHKLYKPLLIFDSYYTDNRGRERLRELKVNYIGAVQSNRFERLL